MKKSVKSKKGFSLVEIITVVAILVILATIAVCGYFSVVKSLPWEMLVGENPFEKTTATETK